MALKIQMLAAAIVYNAVLPADLILVPDVWQASAAIHWLIVSPLMIAAAFAMPPLSSRFIREVLAAASATMMCLQYLFVFLATRSEHADHYQYFVLLDMLFLSMTLRPSFRIYLLVASFVFVLHATAVHFLSELPWQDACMGSLVLGIGIYITLMGSLGHDRRERRSYLFRLRETLRHAEADLSSRHDKLTGFLNRGGLDKALQDLWKGPFSQVAAIMVDIDQFKSYNDHHGHLAGDACVKQMAAVIAGATRQPKDILARFGGDEFLVLLPNTDLREGCRIAERMRRALHEADILHEGADAALYRVKKNGRGGIWPTADRPVLSVIGPGADEIERRSAGALAFTPSA